MSRLTPNRIIMPGFVLNTSATTAPSLTDSSLNTAYKNQLVKVGTDYYFVDATGKAEKLGGGGAPEAVTFGTAAPSSTTALAGDRYFRTDTGVRTGEILEEYIYDGTGWIRMETHRQNFITAITPVYHNGATWVNAQANNAATVADEVKITLADGTIEYVKYGKYTFPSHGLTVGAQYWLDKNVTGGITATAPLSGEIDQAVLFVHDADTIEIKLEQAITPTASTTTAGSMVQMFVNRGVPVTMDNFKVQVNPAGSTLQIASVSGTFNARGSILAEFSTTNTQPVHIVKNAISVTTAWQSADNVGYSLNAAGAKETFDFIDITNFRRYRVTLIINDSYVNNHICIERLA